MPSKKRSGTRAERRRPKIVFFLDRCTNSRALVAALVAAGALVEKHSDHFADDIADEDWLPIVGAKGWVVLTNDKRIRHRQIEREAFMAAGVRAFVLTAGHLSGAEAAELWLRHLRKIGSVATSRTSPFIAHVNRERERIMPVSRRR